VKICDFGWVSEYDGSLRGTFCGTLEYMAPEMLRDKPSYSKEVDIWALGILLYELVHGRAPY